MGPKYCVRGCQFDENDVEVTEYKDISSGFTDFTSAHGIPHITKASGVIKKCVWLLVTLTCIAGLGYNFYSITATYISYPVYVHSTIKQAQGITFPTVSVCNTNPIKKSAVSQNERLQALLASWENAKKRRKRDVSVSDQLEIAYLPHDDITDDTLNRWHATKKRRRKRQTSSCPNPTHNDLCYWMQCEESGGWGSSCRKSYADAVTTCQNEGGVLAIIDTQAKQDHVGDVVGLDSYNQLWIDLVYDPSNSDWMWYGTTELGSNWSNWDSDPGTPTENTCVCTTNNNWETNGCVLAYSSWSDSFMGCSPLCQDDRPYIPSTTAAITTTTAIETTTVPGTTTVIETTTVPETTTVIETTTVPETTTVIETTTVPETTTVIATTTVPETTTAIETTTVPKTTTVIETTTVPETTTVIETTTVPGTTTVIETTTVPETTTVIETTTVPETTTVIETTTVPETTTVIETTTVPETTTAIETTTVPETTTVIETTTVPETTTVIETTTVPETTTIVETTTISETTTIVETTTVSETTIIAETTTVPVTTTAVDTTAMRETTIIVETTTEPETTSETTTVPETTSATDPTTTAYHSIYSERSPPREDFQKEADLMEVLADISLEEKRSMGYNYPEFVLNCMYNGNQCSERDFEHFFDAVHGNCYVFNSGWSESQPIESSSYTGRTKGLHLYLNLGQHEYIESVSEGAGAVIVVNNQTSMPFPGDAGILAPPGYITSIGIRKLEVHRLGGNYGDCVIKEEQGIEHNMFADEHPVKYTFSACEMTCYQRNVINTCSCADPQYPIESQAFGDVSVKPCDARNQTQDDCVYGISLRYINDELDCSCELPCSNEYFTHAISKVLWPSDKEMVTIANRYLSNLTYSGVDEEAYIMNNLLKLEVYFEELNSEYMEEKPKYNFGKYMSDVGSIIGLWIGCSVLSLLEFLELGLDSIVYSIIYCKRKRVKISDSMASLLSKNPKRKNSPASTDCTNSAIVLEEKPPIQHAWSYSNNSRRTRSRINPGSPSQKDTFWNISQSSPVRKGTSNNSRNNSRNSDEGYSSRESSFTKPNTQKNSPSYSPQYKKFVFGAS